GRAHAVDALGVELPRIGADMARVGEVAEAPGVDSHVIGAVEALALPAVGERANPAVLLGNADAAVAAGVRSLAGNEPALRITVEAVGPAAWLAVDGRLAGGRVIAHDAIADVTEIDPAARTVDRALGERALAPHLLNL